MANGEHFHPSDLLGLTRLAVGATGGLTDLVEEMHHTILAGAVHPLRRPTPGRTRGVTGLVYRGIRGTTRLVGRSLEALGGLLPPPGGRPSSSGREAALAVLNGICGDHLEASGNPLAIAMRFREAGRPLELDAAALAAAFPAATGKVLLLIHGLCRNDLQWSRPLPAETPAEPPAKLTAEEAPIAALARGLGYTVLTLHYNSGRPIGVNGRQLAGLLAELAAAWPAPLEELAIGAHSMGGLVARSACHYAAEAGAAWPLLLRRLIFLGTPHLGAPLERGGHWLEQMLDHSPYSAPFVRLARVRSAGITDLRHGRLLDDDTPEGARREVPLPPGVAAFAIAATLAEPEGDAESRLLGDGLVPVASALGLAFPPSCRFVAYGTGHLRMVTSPAVLERIRGWLEDDAPGPR